MKKLLTILSLIIISSPIFANHFVPVQVVPGQEMPETEAEIIKKYHKPNGDPLPVLFKGAALRWPAIQWTSDYLAHHLGEKEIPFFSESYHSDSFPYSLKDFLLEIEKNPNNAVYLDDEVSYHRNETLTLIYRDHDRQELCLGDINPKRDLDPKKNTRFPLMLPTAHHQGFIFFLGSQSTHTKWHNHDEVFLSQIFGKKHVLLIDPNFSIACYTENADFNYDWKFQKYALVPEIQPCPNFTDPNITTENPKLKDLQVFEAILEPGDILYIPYMWLHDVKALSTSFSIAYGF